MISTVNAIIGDQEMDTVLHVTTPVVFDLQRYLRQMLDAGLPHAVLETTSHGLAAKRVLGEVFDIGVVTNITHEHLDYHGDLQGYLDAKAELLRLVANSKEKTGLKQKLAIINRDDQSFLPLLNSISEIGVAWVDYGKEENSPAIEVRGLNDQPLFKAGDFHQDMDGIGFVIRRAGERIPIKSSLLGEYNVSNCLAAATACVEGLGLSWEVVQQGILNLKGIPGRMQRLDLGQKFLVIVDFAHTPNALQVAISAARSLTTKRVITVFGSAGLRDREKRRLMAEISAEMADLTVLTAEDPRTESLDGILEEMAQGVLSKGGIEDKTFWRIPDRGSAIRFALGQADPGDVVMIFGKGHEQSMCFGNTEYPWDDRTAALSVLADLMGKEGPSMPSLPTGDN